jgi:hypothetical protein
LSEWFVSRPLSAESTLRPTPMEEGGQQRHGHVVVLDALCVRLETRRKEFRRCSIWGVVNHCFFRMSVLRLAAVAVSAVLFPSALAGIPASHGRGRPHSAFMDAAHSAAGLRAPRRRVSHPGRRSSVCPRCRRPPGRACRRLCRRSSCATPPGLSPWPPSRCASVVCVRGAVGLQVVRAVGSSAAADAEVEPRAVGAESSVPVVITTARHHVGDAELAAAKFPAALARCNVCVLFFCRFSAECVW